MTTHENDPLVGCLAGLAVELDKENIPVILGGGLSQYLRGKLGGARSPRYPFSAPARSTEDLDLFLSPRLIVDAVKMEGLKLVLSRLGYRVNPKARNFQFLKDIELYGRPREVKIDLLAAPPAGEDVSKVAVKRPRIKPRAAEGIHAYLADESEDIELGKIAVPPELLSPGFRPANDVVFLPSVFNFLVLKLHAFNDSRDDPEKDLGRHHAWDIFASAAGMGEPDWAAARAHLAARAGRPYLRKAAAIRAADFSGAAATGLLRLQDNETYKRDRAVYAACLPAFIEDLAELFPSVSGGG